MYTPALGPASAMCPARTQRDAATVAELRDRLEKSHRSERLKMSGRLLSPLGSPAQSPSILGLAKVWSSYAGV